MHIGTRHVSSYDLHQQGIFYVRYIKTDQQFTLLLVAPGSAQRPWGWQPCHFWMMLSLTVRHAAYVWVQAALCNFKSSYLRFCFQKCNLSDEADAEHCDDIFIQTANLVFKCIV